MKHNPANPWLLTLLALLLLGAARVVHAGPAPPVISNVTARQPSPSGPVEVVFTISDPDTTSAFIYPLVSSDSGTTWAVPSFDLDGYLWVSDVTPTPTRRTNLWHAEYFWPGHKTTQCRVRALAVDSDYNLETRFFPVPAGDYSRGNLSGDADITNAPVYSVHVSDFCYGDVEVCGSQWNLVTEGYALSHGYDLASANQLSGAPAFKAPDHPVYNVSWYDAVKWCNARSQMEGLTPVYYSNAGLSTVYKAGYVQPYVKTSAIGYRLPTEAEWERVARFPSPSAYHTNAYYRFPGGWDVIAHTGNIFNLSANYFSSAFQRSYDISQSRGYNPNYDDGIRPYTSPVSYAGELPSDFAGNVMEWCWDWYGASYYAAGQSDPQGPGSGTSRVLRGGSWAHTAEWARSAARGGSDPSWRTMYFGFRCVVSPEALPHDDSRDFALDTLNSTYSLGPPVIISQPSNLVVPSGGNATFLVSAWWGGALQWRRGGTNLVDGGHISGATSNALTLSNVTTNDAASYTVVITNAVGSVTSSVAVLTVMVPPAITAQPASRTNTVGSLGQFSVTASGGSLAYQWWHNGTNLAGAGQQVVGVTTPQLGLYNLILNEAGSYSVVITNLAGAVTSAVATLTITTLYPSITGSTYAQNFDSMGTNGTVPPAGWYVDFAGPSGTGAISGTSVTVNDGSSDSSGQGGGYNFGSAGSGDRALGSVAGNTPNSSRATEVRLINATGAWITALTISYTGEQWRQGGTNSVNNQLVMRYSTNGANFTALGAAFDFNTPYDAGPAGALNGNAASNRVAGIGGTYTPAAPITNGETFYLRWWDAADTGGDHGLALDDLSITFAFSNVPPVIVTQPESQFVYAGSNATFTVAATGSGTFTYQWKFNDTNVIAGATNPLFTVTGAQNSDAGNYSVVVNNAAAVTSSNALLGVLVPPLPQGTLTAAMSSNGVFVWSLTDVPLLSFTALSATNISLPLSNWTVLGPFTEIAPGEYQFTNAPAPGAGRRFYTVRPP